MDRRGFIKTVAAAGIGTSLGGSAAAAAEGEATAPGQLPRREMGRSGQMLSVIGFGGVLVNRETPATAADRVAEAVDLGVNFFDVAPSYGNAEERLGPAIEPCRDRCFLANKTAERTAEGARRELEASLRLLRTDRFELYQIHALSRMEQVEEVFGPGGAMETLVAAREEGKARWLGFSAHSVEAAMAAMDRFDFDTIMFPFNYASWLDRDFGPRVFQRAREKGVGLLAIKAMVARRFDSPEEREASGLEKAWYLPLETPEPASLGLRFVLNLPVATLIPPGEYDLYRMALDLARSGEATPLTEEERGRLRALAMELEGRPIFG